jgi:hypothetical protein
MSQFNSEVTLRLHLIFFMIWFNSFLFVSFQSEMEIDFCYLTKI